MPTTTPKWALPRPSTTDPADGPDGFNDLTDVLDPLMAVQASGTEAAKPAAGKAGRLYWNTDLQRVEFDNGTAWIVLAGTGEIGYSNTLPASPVDLQECYYVVPVYNLIWHLIWQAGAGRWMYLGGGPLQIADGNDETRGPFGAAYPTFIALNSAGTLTLPKGGQFDINVEAMVQVPTGSGAVASVRIRPFQAGLVGLSGQPDSQITLNTANEWWQYKQWQRVSVPPPGGDIILGSAVAATGNTVRYARKLMTITPVYLYP